MNDADQKQEALMKRQTLGYPVSWKAWYKQLPCGCC